jgi:hypothetical protein
MKMFKLTDLQQNLMVKDLREYKRGRFKAERKYLQLAVISIIMLCCARGSFAQSFVLSARPEFSAISGAAFGGDTSVSKAKLDGKPVKTGIAAGGWAIETGLISKGRGFYTVSVHGGFNGSENIGAFLNIGTGNTVESAGGGIGFSLGFHRVPYHVNVVKNGDPYDRYTDYNYIIGGPFLKLLFGQTNNFDITSKILFGYRESHYVIKDSGEYRYHYDDNASDIHYGMIATFSMGVGYTLTTGRR